MRTSEKGPGSGLFLRFLYDTAIGRVLLLLLSRAAVSKAAGAALNAQASRIFIKSFIKNNSIDMGEYKQAAYKSFNDFFIRELKDGRRRFPENAHDLAAPCDAKLTAYHITPNRLFTIKRAVYDIEGLLEDSGLAEEYGGGLCLVFRLSPDDYHRYVFIDDGEILQYKKIKGALHTVRPIAHNRYKVYAQNSREYTVMQTRNFDKVVQMEVGAMFVGKITNRVRGGAVKRGGQKGYFEFGGSTIILLFKKGVVNIDETIINNSLIGNETVVKLGGRIGCALSRKTEGG